ncbi:MAG TPA: glycosyltransferase family 39 protein [Gemmata sp.]
MIALALHARFRNARLRGLRARPRASSALWLLALGFLFLFHLGARDLVSSHEARAAQHAQRMLDTGDWGLPTLFDGQADLQKPPGFYWLVAAVGWLNGGHVSPWVARLPSALGALASVLLVYGFLRREGYAVGALVGAVVLATANHFVAIGRTARIDVPLTCAVTVSLLAFYRGSLGPRASRPQDRSAPESAGGTPVRQVPLQHRPVPGGQGEPPEHAEVEPLCGPTRSPRSCARREPPEHAEVEPLCGRDARGPKGRYFLFSAVESLSGPTRSPRSCARREPPEHGEVEPLCGRDARGPRGRYFLLSAAAAGVAVLLKGPVGLALIGTTAVAFLAVDRLVSAPGMRPRLPLGSALLGVAVVAGVAGPWFVWAQHATNGEFGRVFFWYHNVARFTGEAEALASHPWWYYGPRFALAFLPWTLLLPLVVWGGRSGVWTGDRAFRFGLVWAVVMVAVLSAARFKRADYLLPAFPGAALALGCAAERWLAARAEPRSVWRAKLGFGVLVAAGLAVWPVMWGVVEPAEAARHEARGFATAVRARAPKPEPVLLFRTESHVLAYHLGAPLHTLVEWGELKDALATGPRVVVMPPEYVDEAGRVTGHTFVPVAALADFTSVRPHRPLVCLRTAE